MRIGLTMVCALALSVSACGGGGGGAATATAPAPAPVPVVTGPIPIVLSSSNYKAAAGLSFDLTDTAIGMADIAIAPLQDYANRGSVQSGAGSCSLGGSVSVVVDDRDRSLRVSAGDTLAVTYSGCRTGSATVEGAVTASLQTVTVSGGALRLLMTVNSSGLRFNSTSNAAVVITVSCAMTVDFSSNSNGDRIQITNSTLSVNDSSGTDSASSLSIDFDQHYDTFRFTLSTAGNVGSAALGGTYTFETAVVFAGVINSYPTSGRMLLRGGSGSIARVAEEGAAASNSATLDASVDGNGDGTPEFSNGSLAWDDVSSPVLFSPYREGVVAPVSPGGGTGGGVTPVPPSNATLLLGRSVPLGGVGADVELDVARSQLYVSVPSRNEVVVISTNSYQVIDRIVVGSSPIGLNLSIDGATLYVANNTGGSVSAITLATRSIRSFPVAAVLQTAMAYDVLEYSPGKILVTGNPNSSGFARLVSLDIASGNAVTVAGTSIIRADPILLIDQDRHFVYVGEGFSPNSVYKIDVTAADLPIVLEDQHGTVNGTGAMALNQDGSRLLLTGGQVLRTGSLLQDSLLNVPGQPQFSTDFSQLWMVAGGTQISSFNGQSFQPASTYTTDCPNGTLRAVRSTGARRWALLLDSTLCVVDTATPATPPGQPGSTTPADPPLISLSGVRAELGGIGAATAVDSDGQKLYVSVPSRNEVVVLSTSTLAVQRRIAVAGRPQGITLSSDRSTLYVALNETGSLAYVDTAAGNVTTTVSLQTLLDHPTAWDVIETSPNRIFVSANPSSGGLAYIVEVRRDQANAAKRVASDRIIRAAPVFAVTPDKSSLFVGEGFSPESIYKLDLAQSAAPLVAEDEHGSVSGTSFLAVSPDSQRLFTTTGMVISAATVRQQGLVGAGIPLPMPNGRDVYVAAANGEIRRYDATTYVLLQRIQTNCALPAVTRLVTDATGSVLIMQGSDLVCRVVVPTLN